MQCWLTVCNIVKYAGKVKNVVSVCYVMDELCRFQTGIFVVDIHVQFLRLGFCLWVKTC